MLVTIEQVLDVAEKKKEAAPNRNVIEMAGREEAQQTHTHTHTHTQKEKNGENQKENQEIKEIKECSSTHLVLKLG